MLMEIIALVRYHDYEFNILLDRIMANVANVWIA
jgi:hypothetical protein